MRITGTTFPDLDDDRQQFLQDNALSIIAERDETIIKLKKQVTRLHQMVKSLRITLKLERKERDMFPKIS